MASSPLQGIGLPNPDDANDVPGDLAAVVVALEKRCLMRFDSDAARSAAISSPEDGMITFVGSGSSARVQIRLNGTWVDMHKDEKLTWATAPFQNGYAGTLKYVVTRDKWVHIRWICTTSIAAGASVFPLAILPEAIRPDSDAPANVAGTGQYDMTGSISAAGNLNVRNTHSAAVTAHSGMCSYLIDVATAS